MKGTDRDSAPAELSRGPEAIGALSRIGEHSVQAALAIARRGHVFDLGLEFNSRIPHNPEFVRFATLQCPTASHERLRKFERRFINVSRKRGAVCYGL